MWPTTLLFVVYLLRSCETEGTWTPVFVQTGKNLILDVKKPVVLGTDEDIKWLFNSTTTIVKYSDNKQKTFTYGDRAKINASHYSLYLKNVQRNDSGSYTARVSGAEVQDVAKYEVTIEDPVSPVELTVNSCSSSNVTVTCSTVDSHISSTFTCHDQTCSQEGGQRSKATTHPSTISVYLNQSFILCNHSNHVSWEQAKETFVCGPDPVPSAAIGAGFGAGTIGLIIIAVLFMKYKKKNNGNTEYEVPQEITPAQTLNQNPTEYPSGLFPTKDPKRKSLPDTMYAQVNTSAKTNSRSSGNLQHRELKNTAEVRSGLSPTSTYCFVKFHTGPEKAPKCESLPETVYAEVNRPTR